jgi:hypothetical protein
MELKLSKPRNIMTIEYKDRVFNLLNDYLPRQWKALEQGDLFFEEDDLYFRYSIKGYDWCVIYSKETKAWSLYYLKYLHGDYWTPSMTDYIHQMDFTCLESASFKLLSEIALWESRRLTVKSEAEETAKLMSEIFENEEVEHDEG